MIFFFEMMTTPNRYRHEIVFHNNVLIVFGGGTNMEAYGLIKLPAYDLQKKDWTVIATQGDMERGGVFPAPRRCLSLSHVGQCECEGPPLFHAS